MALAAVEGSKEVVGWAEAELAAGAGSVRASMADLEGLGSAGAVGSVAAALVEWEA